MGIPEGTRILEIVLPTNPDGMATLFGGMRSV